MSRKTFKIGQKFNYLTIQKSFIKEIGNQGRKILLLECLCDCGGKTITTITKLRSGHTKSCGCLWDYSIWKHGQCGTATYRSWTNMKNRCFNPKNERYADYGGRGITVCEKWLDFKNFYKDMGDRPEGKTIDKIDNNGNYCKENCRWATNEQQYNNKRSNVFLLFNGKKKTITEWADYLKINMETLRCRVKRGWTIERALTTKVRKRG